MALDSCVVARNKKSGTDHDFSHVGHGSVKVKRFGRRHLVLGVVLARPHAVIVVEIDVHEARELAILQDESVGKGIAMLERQVVDLVLGIQPDFPVGVLVDFVGAQQLHLAERTACKLVGDATKELEQGLARLRIEIDEDEAFPDRARDRREPVRALVQIVEVLFVRHVGQLTFSVIRPVVEAAGEAAGKRPCAFHTSLLPRCEQML